MATSRKGSSGGGSDSSEKEALQALDKIERVVTKQEESAAAAGIDLKQACKVYNQIRPLLKTALPLIEKIPVYGKKIAAAIRATMQVADVACAI